MHRRHHHLHLLRLCRSALLRSSAPGCGVRPFPALAVVVVGRRDYSAGKRPGFFQNIVENVKSEYAKSKEMQDSLKRFREEAQKLEDSEALKEARKKFESIEGETAKGSSAIKEKLSGITGKVKESLEDIGKTEAAKRLGKTAETLGDAAESIGRSGAFRAASSSAATLKREIEGHTLGGKVYRAPARLRKRKESTGGAETFAVNEEATGVELHKDSKFFASWQRFKDNNPVVNKFVDYRLRYEESDNPLVRGARILTDKVHDIFGGLFARTELSEVLTEIVKMDPNFCKEQFLKDCETDLIPNVLEAMIRGDLEILQDWCYEAAFSVLAAPVRRARQLGHRFDSAVLDVDNIDLAMGKMMDQGPVLVVTFTSQQIVCVRDAKGGVVEGDPEKVMRVMYVWVLCRDQAELDPKAAWRLLELSASSSVQFL